LAELVYCIPNLRVNSCLNFPLSIFIYYYLWHFNRGTSYYFLPKFSCWW